MLTNEERRYLLTLARKALEYYLKGETFTPPAPPLEYKNSYEKRGAFVTLTKKGRLRGCIGSLEGDKPLYQLIPELALSSAFQDPRFPPLSAEELPEIKIEISILSPLYPGRPEEVEVGKHGIYIVRGFNRGVLLPQVATEYNLTREEFLRQGCLKAGLPEDCYKDPKTKLYLFTAEVFEED
jgi:AmmeMemoRadiSam system protein A